MRQEFLASIGLEQSRHRRTRSARLDSVRVLISSLFGGRDERLIVHEVLIPTLSPSLSRQIVF